MAPSLRIVRMLVRISGFRLSLCLMVEFDRQRMAETPDLISYSSTFTCTAVSYFTLCKVPRSVC